MKFYIRPITKRDIKVLIPMYKKNFAHLYPFDEDGDWVQEEFERAFVNHWRRPHYFVGVYKDKIIAMGAYEHSPLDGGLYDLINIQVNEPYRGKGIASGLIEYLLREIRFNFSEKSDQTVILSCAKKLKPFYSKFGFKVIMTKAAKQEYIMALSYPHKGNKIKY